MHRVLVQDRCQDLECRSHRQQQLHRVHRMLVQDHQQTPLSKGIDKSGTRTYPCPYFHLEHLAAARMQVPQ